MLIIKMIKIGILLIFALGINVNKEGSSIVKKKKLTNNNVKIKKKGVNLIIMSFVNLLIYSKGSITDNNIK